MDWLLREVNMDWVLIICGGFLAFMFLAGIGAVVCGLIMSSDGKE